MSYFGTIYADTELPSRAKAVYMYLRDRSDAEGECEERLSHSSEYGLGEAVLMHEVVEIRPYVEHETIMTSGKKAGMDRKYEHEKEEYDHHDLRDLLNAVLQTDYDNSCCQKQRYRHIDDLEHRICGECAEERHHIICRERA